MGRIYGYCRISTGKQSIDRQVRNIKAAFPEAVIVREIFTGTKTEGRKKWEALRAMVKGGDTIVFDSVSRMSRNAEEGIAQYFEFYEREIRLVFLKERYIDTDTYRQAVETGVTLTGTEVDYILEGVNRYLLALARTQIRIAFDQAQKEVDDLHQRTREGIETARLDGKAIGRPAGAVIETAKAKRAKELIREHCREFGGTLKDVDVMVLAGVTKKSFYKYKRECLQG